MEQSQAISVIQRAWRNHLFFRNSYRKCYNCKALFLSDKNKGYLNLCTPCIFYIESIEKANKDYRRGRGPPPKERIHYCNDYFCNWDCGILDCGCIDMCRGRCGCRPRHWRN